MSYQATKELMVYVSIPVQLLCGVFCLLVIKRFLPVKGILQNIAIYLAAMLTVNSAIFIGEYKVILVLVVFFVGCMCLFCKGKLIARFSMGMILFSLMISTTACLFNIHPPFDLFIRFYALALWVAIYLVLRNALPASIAEPIQSTRLWLLIDMLVLMPFGSTLAIVALAEVTKVPLGPDPEWFGLENLQYVIQNETVLVVVLALAMVCSLALLAAVVVLSRHEKLEREQTLWQVRNQYYQSMEQAQQQVQRLRHDMRNHLAVMAGLENDGMRSYLDNLLETPAISTGQVFCENRIVSAVVSNKMPSIEEGNIDATFEIILPEDLPISEIDLCAVFANSLDNAIEANLDVPAGERRLLLRASAEKGLFTLSLENAMHGYLRKKDGVIATKKADAANHGFGLSGMKEIVERYHGTMEIRQEGQSFQMLISIPLHL